MFKIDYILENLKKEDILCEGMTKEEKENSIKAKNLAIKLSDSLMKMGYAIQGYDEKYRNLIPDSMRKSNFLKAAKQLQDTLGKAGIILKDGTLYEYPEFRFDIEKWKLLKKMASDPEKLFISEPGSKEAKSMARELDKFAIEIKKRNWVDPAGLSSKDFAKDLSDNPDQENKYYGILSRLNSKNSDSKEIEKDFENLEKKATKDAKEAFKTRKQYLDDIRNARETGAEAPKIVKKMVDRTGVGAGFKTKGLDSVRKSEVEKLEKNSEVNLIDTTKSGIDWNGKHFKNIKLLCKAWAEAKVPMEGQIKVISKTNMFNKPIAIIGNKIYMVPRNDLLTNARGGVGTVDSPYYKYVEYCTKNKDYDDIRKKILG